MDYCKGSSRGPGQSLDISPIVSSRPSCEDLESSVRLGDDAHEVVFSVVERHRSVAALQAANGDRVHLQLRFAGLAHLDQSRRAKPSSAASVASATFATSCVLSAKRALAALNMSN